MNYLYKFHVKRTKVFFAHEGVALNDLDSAVAFLSAFTKELDREHFFVVHMDRQCRVLGYEQVAIGGMSDVEVHPREVFRAAILAGAATIVIAHNHPSGDLAPSPDDMRMYEGLCQAGDILGIPVLDSIILADGEYYSTEENSE